MLLSSSDDQTVKQITIIYCTVTVAFTSILLTIIILTGHYVLLGCLDILPVFSLIVFVEVLKWTYAQHCYYEESLPGALEEKTVARFFSYLRHNLKIVSVLKCATSQVAACVAYYVLAVLFGAPLLEDCEKTFMFSVLLTILTVHPLCMNCGPDSLNHLINGKVPKNMLHILLHKNVVGTLVGAWFGAFAIPLDWDRPWQIWPIPCSTGALIGHSVCHFVMLINIYLSTNTKIGKLSRKKH